MHPATLLGALLSAVLSYAALLVVPQVPVAGFDAGDLVPGLIFGVLVLAARSIGPWSAVTLIALSAIVHVGARETALTLHAKSWPPVAACAVAGTLAAYVLSVVYSRIAHHAAAWKRNLRVAAIGGAAGILIGLGLRAQDDGLAHALIFSGYAAWQVGFALIHAILPRWWPEPKVAAPARD